MISGATEPLVVDQLPHAVPLTDLGAHPLRDLPRPERVFQVCHPDLRNDFPPLRTATSVVSQNLPAQLTSFVGRQAEMSGLRDALSVNRLVTLTGAGGVGKTRLGRRNVPRRQLSARSALPRWPLRRGVEPQQNPLSPGRFW